MSWPSISAVVALVGPARAAVVLTVIAVVLLTYVGLRLLLAQGTAVCRRLDALPPHPLRAVSAGVAFSVSGCPGCAPVAAAVGTDAAGGRWLTPDDARKARRVDVVIAVLLLLSAAYYAWRLVDGQVLTVLPGEGGLLP